MTANANLVSNRTPTPTTQASAIQARANSQSAAIALLGAGTSSLSQGEGSFADSLQSESKRQTSPQGLFSDDANSARPAARAERSSAEPSRRDETRDPKPAPTQDGPRTGPLSGRPRNEKSGSQTDEPPTEVPITLDDIRTARDPNPVQGGSPNAATANVAAQNPQANAEANDPASDQAAATNQKSQRATDPLRLIVPQPAAASDAQNASGAEIASQNQTAQIAAQTASISHTATRSIAVRKNEASSGTNGVGQSTAVNSTMSAGTGVPVHGTTGPSSTAQSNGAVTGIAGASGTSGGTSVGAPLDQVAPPRVPGGKAIEQPVTLKLKMGPATSNNSPQLTETEITAAETQIGRGLTAAFRQNTPQVTLWMSPETLGKVRIELTFDQGTISARFEATSEATRDLLAQNMGALRDALQSRGLTASQIEVVSIPDWSQQNGSQSGSNQGGSANQQSPNQPSSGGQTPSGQGGQQQQSQSDHSKGWVALPQGEATSKPESASDALVSIAIDSRMMALQAHLELDAVA
jgi:flagellar hook-length control protein FliK